MALVRAVKGQRATIHLLGPMIFISYSRTDARLVLPLVQFLRASGSDVFVDQEDLDFGSDWESELSKAICQSDRLLLFWSRASRLSGPVRREVDVALATGTCKIVPVMLDHSVLPEDLRRFHGSADMQFLARALRRQRVIQVALWILPFAVATLAVWWSGPFRRQRVLTFLDPSHPVVFGFRDALEPLLIIALPWLPIAYWLFSKRRARALYAKAVAALQA